MGVVLLILQIVSALIFIVLMAVQTDKNDGGAGVMGLGAQGGRMSGSIDMPVGAERILKPMSKWSGIGFLFASVLAAAHSELAAPASGGIGLPWYVLLGAIAIYAFVMLFGDKVWAGFLRTFGAGQ